MSLTFYYAPYSTASVTVAVLNELEHGLPSPLAKRVELSISAGDTRKPEYLSTVNPNGRIPAIVHDGVSVWESAAITMYLGETFGVAGSSGRKESLYPDVGPKRGEAMKWIVWSNVTLAEAGGRLAAAAPAGTAGAVAEGSKDFVLESERSKTDGTKAKDDIANCLSILDGALRDKDFLLGHEYCLADTHVYTFVGWVDMMGASADAFASVKAWMARVGERPALKNGDS